MALFFGVTRSIFRIDDAQLQRVPDRGPLILVMNHVNLWEIPLIYAHLQPRRVHGMVLADRWKNPLLAWGLDVCESIPLARGEMNLDSMHKALEILQAGSILLLAPEGTRSGHGRLQEGHPGVVPLALKSQAPILPIASYGGEQYQQNLKKLRRTNFHLVVGKPFHLDPGTEPVTRAVRKQMIDQVMYQMASLLPPPYRGRYADLSQVDTRYLIFS